MSNYYRLLSPDESGSAPIKKVNGFRDKPKRSHPASNASLGRGGVSGRVVPVNDKYGHGAIAGRKLVFPQKTNTEMTISLEPTRVIPDHLLDLKIAPHLPQIMEFIMSMEKKVVDAPRVLIESAGTGTGKTIGTGQCAVRFLRQGFQLIISVPLIACAEGAYKYAIQMMPEHAHEFAFRAGGYTKGDIRNAKVVYATTQSVLNYLMTLSPEKLGNVCIMIDEAHVSTIENQSLQAYCNHLLEEGVDMRIIMATATMTRTKFTALQKGITINIDERQHPLKIAWSETDNISISRNDGKMTAHCDKREIMHWATDKIVEVFKKQGSKGFPKGNILCFVSGHDEADDICDTLRKSLDGVTILPIYAGLAEEDRDAVRDATDSGIPCIIIGTDAVESGVTFDVDYIIHTMLHKQKIEKNGVATIIEVPISQKSAIQAAGRTARKRSGMCFYACTEETYNQLEPDDGDVFENIEPYIPILNFLKHDLPAGKILQIDSVEYKRYTDRLILLGLIDAETSHVTEFGMNICKYPLSLPSAITLLNAEKLFRTSGIDKLLLEFMAMACAGVDAKLATTNALFVPRESRKPRDKEVYIKHQFYKYRNQESDIAAYVLMMLDCMISQKVYKTSVSEWCKIESVNFKFMEQMMRLHRQIHRAMFGIDIDFATIVALKCKIDPDVMSNLVSHIREYGSDGTSLSGWCKRVTDSCKGYIETWRRQKHRGTLDGVNYTINIDVMAYALSIYHKICDGYQSTYVLSNWMIGPNDYCCLFQKGYPNAIFTYEERPHKGPIRWHREGEDVFNLETLQFTTDFTQLSTMLSKRVLALCVTHIKTGVRQSNLISLCIPI